MQGRGSSGVLPRSLVRDARTRCWYSAHLDAMEERPLREAVSTGGEAYRFLWLRTFHRPVVIRVVARNGQIVLETKETDGHGGYAPGRWADHVQGCWTNTELTQPRPVAFLPGEVLIKLARLRIPADAFY